MYRIAKVSFWLTHRSESHSEHLDPLVELSGFGVAEQSEYFQYTVPLHNIFTFWVELLQCLIVRVGLSQYLKGGGPMIQVQDGVNELI